jgi:hypothetical protein
VGGAASEVFPKSLGQRKDWLIRHTGTTHLTCNILNVLRTSPEADECISIRDDENGVYTSYVHFGIKIRGCILGRLLSNAAGIIDFKIVNFSGKKIQSTYHFWDIAAGIHFNHRGLKVDRLHSIAGLQRKSCNPFAIFFQSAQALASRAEQGE